MAELSQIGSLQEELLHEHDRCVELIIAIRLLAEAVTLILPNQVPNGDTILAHCAHDLVRLTKRDNRVFITLNDKQRFRDCRGIVEWRQTFEKGPHFWISLVTVLHASKISTVRSSVLQESYEVRWSDNIHGASDAAGVSSRRDQCNVSAIAGTRHHNSIRIEIWLRLDPVE